MIDFFSGSQFRFFWLPLITVVLTILIKAAFKRQTMKFLEKEDFAIGPNLITTSIFIVVSKISIVALNINDQRLTTLSGTEIIMRLVIYLLLMLVGLVILMTIVSRYGWETDMVAHRQCLKTFPGIVLPDIVGLAYLIFAFTMNIDPK